MTQSKTSGLLLPIGLMCGPAFLFIVAAIASGISATLSLDAEVTFLSSFTKHLALVVGAVGLVTFVPFLLSGIVLLRRRSRLKNDSKLLQKGARTEDKTRLVGVNGWLAWFTVAAGLGILSGIISLYSDTAVLRELTSGAAESEVASEYAAALRSFIYFDMVRIVSLMVMLVAVIGLIAKRKRIGKAVAIGYFIISIFLGTISYTWGSAVLEIFIADEAVRKEMISAGVAGFPAISASIWIPYLLLSKRVRDTLVR